MSNSPVQACQYDKIIKENMNGAMPDILSGVLGIQAAKAEDLAERIQHTKERIPDQLKKITDDSGETFVLHIEWQLKNDAEMIDRMLEYRAMLRRKYRINIRQYVFFMGQMASTMVDSIEERDLKFSYRLIVLYKIDYKLFLASEKPEQKILAVLGNFNFEAPEVVLRKIIEGIKAKAEGGLAEQRYLNQLRVLVQLRNLETQFNHVMEPASTVFKEERDPYYIKGFKKGAEKERIKASSEFTERLILGTGYTNEVIAVLAGVTIAFVKAKRQAVVKKNRMKK
ncbi:hypothetical protein SAMN05421820_101172 [Pedobacter steynii]|uniref:Transposase (putative) YhgA-like domain-containing protein n=1 Tax=Pedobacter steynii TaxID=430522 RepID=A0A1G9J729_9SPHI|nr:hypothetical protein [Pedobacter steynii]NQX38163.1 hypothetical protein [Pedobacter steynii]SDL33338.1 hypothetical protein SAMN05421820_101172 [Pedobacter steynii]